jgi:diguanylate cyclase (GGDEF)-like protein
MSLDPSRVLAAASENLPSLPAAALKALTLAQQVDPDLGELVTVIKSDSALAAKVLSVASSTSRGGGRVVSSVDEAVFSLGLAVLRIAIESHLAALEASARVHAAEQEVQRLQTEIDQLANAAFYDTLTGLHNRRFFDELLEHERARCSRYGDAMGLIFLDIDLFKKLNDTHGHRCGDEALRLVARVIRASVRQSDVVARYGGEEFVILALSISRKGLGEMAERVRQSIAATELLWEGRAVRVTASLGATYCDPGSAEYTTPTALVESADRALYGAKRGGRNRVQIAV